MQKQLATPRIVGNSTEKHKILLNKDLLIVIFKYLTLTILKILRSSSKQLKKEIEKTFDSPYFFK
jgi:hypothetical protein